MTANSIDFYSTFTAFWCVCVCAAARCVYVCFLFELNIIFKFIWFHFYHYYYYFSVHIVLHMQLICKCSVRYLNIDKYSDRYIFHWIGFYVSRHVNSGPEKIDCSKLHKLLIDFEWISCMEMSHQPGNSCGQREWRRKRSEKKKPHQSICVDCALICKFIVIEMMNDERWKEINNRWFKWLKWCWICVNILN